MPWGKVAVRSGDRRDVGEFKEEARDSTSKGWWRTDLEEAGIGIAGSIAGVGRGVSPVMCSEQQHNSISYLIV